MAIFREVVRGDGSGIAEYYRVIDGKVFNVDYNVIVNKPTLNGSELLGDLDLTKMMQDEGFLQTEADPTVPEYIKVITEGDIVKWQASVDAEYVSDAIGRAIAGVSQFSLLPVDELPTENIETNVIYAIPSTQSKLKNAREEYVYINGDWECIGTTMVDLSNYYTKQETDNQITTKIEEISAPEVDMSNYYDKTTIDNKFISTFKYLGHANTTNQLPAAADPSTKPESSEDEEEIIDDPTVKAATLLYSDTLLEKVSIYKNNILEIVNHFHLNGYSFTNAYGNTFDYPDEGQYILAFNVNTLGTEDIKVRLINLSNTGQFIKSYYGGSYQMYKQIYFQHSGSEHTYHITNGVVTKDSNYSSGTYSESFYFGTSDTDNPTLKSVIVDVNDWYYYTGLLIDDYKQHESEFKEDSSNTNIPIRLNNGSLYIQPTTINTYKFLKSFGGALEPRYDLEINSIYTVGANNEIYRLNEIYQWEALSTVNLDNYYTKDEIDDLFGTAEAALDAIIEGGI